VITVTDTQDAATRREADSHGWASTTRIWVTYDSNDTTWWKWNWIARTLHTIYPLQQSACHPTTYRVC